MKIMYNVTGAERKALVKAVSEITGARAEYQGVPRCGYQIGCFEIDKQGTLIIPANTDADAVERLITQLDMKGFTCAGREGDGPEATQEAAQEAIQLPLALESDGTLEEAVEPEDTPLPTEAMEADEPQEEAAPEAEPEDEPLPDEAPESDEPQEEAAAPETLPEEDATFAFEVPLQGFTDTQLQNLEKLVASKASLIKKSLGVDDLPIVKNEDRLAFPWFHRELTSFEIQTYTHFIAALCKVAKTQTRVTAKDKDVPSERFTFRLFLLKLGFAGQQYADERKLLYTNLSGDCAFPTTAKRDEHAARWSEIRKSRRGERRSNQGEADTANTEVPAQEQAPVGYTGK